MTYSTSNLTTEYHFAIMSLISSLRPGQEAVLYQKTNGTAAEFRKMSQRKEQIIDDLGEKAVGFEFTSERAFNVETGETEVGMVRLSVRRGIAA